MKISKILIVHGWLHSAGRYVDLKAVLEKKIDAQVLLYEFPGFGDSEACHYKNILKNYTYNLKQYILENKPDIIIAHSMGGNIVLRVMEDITDPIRLILLSPEYYGIDILKPCIILRPIATIGMKLLRRPSKISDVLIKIMALFTINKWRLVDDKIIEDTRKADPVVAINVMYEMIFDRWRLCQTGSTRKEVLLVLGEHDRIISKKKMKLLKEDLCNCKVIVIKEIGHTAIIEAFEDLCKIILEYLKTINNRAIE